MVRLFGRSSSKVKGDILQASADNNVELVKTLLAQNPSLRRQKDSHHWQALHFASNTGALGTVDVLLNWGADPNAHTDSLRTPLHLAVQNGHFSVVKRLLERGAEPWRVSKNNRNALHYAVKLSMSDEHTANAMIKHLLHYKQHALTHYDMLVYGKDDLGNTPIDLGKELQVPVSVIKQLLEVRPPEKHNAVTILLHGWNDNIKDWEVIERNFTEHLNRPFHLFAYNSLANRVSIPTLAADLHKFILEKRDAYAKKLAKVSWSRLTKGSSSEEKTDKPEVAVNIVCYSTGGLIVRTFLHKWYKAEFRNVISRVVMLAPANFGSPFAKFGKSSVGRMYVGQKNVKSLFECGEELLTSLEPGSPFLWELCHKDALIGIEQQYFTPEEIMCTIIQGTQHYEKNLQSKVTRGDMRGSDGTVTVSGASLRIVKVGMNIIESSKEPVIMQKSTADVALRLHPAHTHRSLIDSLVGKTDAFYVVIQALDTDRDTFKDMQKSFQAQMHNSVVYSPCHTPGSLLVFKSDGHKQPVVVPKLFVHDASLEITFGQSIDQHSMVPEKRGSVVGPIRDEWSNVEYHSRSRNMFYKIVDLAYVGSVMSGIAGDLPGKAVSLALCLKGVAQHGRIIGSTAWKAKQGYCFPYAQPDTTILFSLSEDSAGGAVAGTLQSIADLGSGGFTDTDAVSEAMRRLKSDDELDESLSDMGTVGILRLCRLFFREGDFSEFIKTICYDQCAQLSGKTRAQVVRSLVPFFEEVPATVEAACHLIVTTSSDDICSMKAEFDCSHADEDLARDYNDLPRPVMCDSIHDLVSRHLKPVPWAKLRELSLGSEHTVVQPGQLGRVLYLDTAKYVSFYINTQSMLAEKVSQRLIILLEDTLLSCEDSDYIPDVVYPGALAFITGILGNNDVLELVMLYHQSMTLPPELELEHVSIRYEDRTSEKISEALLSYLHLYPECEFALVGNGHSRAITPALSAFLKHRAMHLWSMFRDVGAKNCKRFHDMQENDEIFDCFATYLGAALKCHEDQLLCTENLVRVARESVEQVHLCLLRKQGINAPDRWNELITCLEAVAGVLEQQPPSAERNKYLFTVKSLVRESRQALVAMTLSDTGIEMLLRFNQFVSDKHNEANQTRQLSRSSARSRKEEKVPEERYNYLVSLCENSEGPHFVELKHMIGFKRTPKAKKRVTSDVSLVRKSTNLSRRTRKPGVVMRASTSQYTFAGTQNERRPALSQSVGGQTITSARPVRQGRSSSDNTADPAEKAGPTHGSDPYIFDSRSRTGSGHEGPPKPEALAAAAAQFQAEEEAAARAQAKATSAQAKAESEAESAVAALATEPREGLTTTPKGKPLPSLPPSDCSAPSASDGAMGHEQGTLTSANSAPAPPPRRRSAVVGLPAMEEVPGRKMMPARLGLVEEAAASDSRCTSAPIVRPNRRLAASEPQPTIVQPIARQRPPPPSPVRGGKGPAAASASTPANATAATPTPAPGGSPSRPGTPTRGAPRGGPLPSRNATPTRGMPRGRGSGGGSIPSPHGSASPARGGPPPARGGARLTPSGGATPPRTVGKGKALPAVPPPDY